MSEAARAPEVDRWEVLTSQARSSLTEARSKLAVAWEGVRHMENAASDALWALSRVVTVQRREDGRHPQDLRSALHELAESCETAATIGRGVDRLVDEAVDQVRTVTAITAEVPPAMTGQDQIDRVALRTRLATLEEELVRSRPLVEQAVVRLGWAAEYARQAIPAQGRAAMPFPVDNVNRRLSDAVEAGATLRRELTHARQDTDRARGQVDAICEVARARMGSHRDHTAPAGGRTTSPGMGI